MVPPLGLLLPHGFRRTARRRDDESASRKMSMDASETAADRRITKTKTFSEPGRWRRLEITFAIGRCDTARPRGLGTFRGGEGRPGPCIQSGAAISMRYAERRTAPHSAGVVSYNKLEPAGVEVAVEGEGGRRSREPAGSAGAFVYAVSSRETLALARPRKVSPVTFNFRTPFEKAPFLSFSLPLSLSLSLSFSTAVRSPTANWVDDRVPCRVASRRCLGSSAFGREKLFPARTFQEASKRNRESTRFCRVSRAVRSSKPLDFSTSSTRRGDSQSCSRTIV